MVNKVILLGRVGNDPMMHEGEGFISVSFPLATSMKYKNKQGVMVEQTEWHNIVTYSNVATICEKYVSKGNLLHVEGRINTRTWTDKNGEKKYKTEIIASNVTFLPKQTSNDTTPKTDSINDDDDLPF